MLAIAAIAQLALCEFPPAQVTLVPTRPAVGWGGFKHRPEDLERRIKEQQGFGPRWYEEFLTAQQAALDKAKTVKSPKQREILIEAVAAAQEVKTERAVIDLSPALRAAVGARRVTASIKHARAVIQAAFDDDEEAITLLSGAEMDFRTSLDDEEAIELLLLHG